MRKCAFIFFIICLLAFMACDTGTGSSSSDLVAVSFSLETTDGRITDKMVSTSTPISLEGAVFQYKASPAWQSTEFATIQGTQTEWTDFTQNSSIGLFAQGTWEFQVRILSATSTVLYKGSNQCYISSGSNTVSVSLFRQSEGEGRLAVQITSPTVSDNDKLVIKYGLASDMNTPLGTYEDASKTSTGTGEDRRSTFSKEIYNLDAGLYWVTLAYNNGVTDVGGAIAFVDVIGQEESTLTGTIEAGEWQTCTIVSTGIKSFGIIIRAAGNASSVVSGQDLVFTCTKASEEFEDIISYQWYVDGEKQSATGSTFTFNREYDPYASNSNFYRINCIAGDSSTPQICADAIWHIVVKEN